MDTTTNTEPDKATCIRSLELMATGSVEEFAEVYGPEATNREAKDEPTAARGRGPEALHATAEWLRAAYSDLHGPPSPVYLARMLLARRRARRS